MTSRDKALSDQMTDYLCSFAKTGDPNCAGQPKWFPAAGQNKVLCMGEQPTRMAKPNMLKLWYTMLTKKNVGE